MSGREEVTRLLLEWQAGNQAAVDLLIPIVYQELRRLAARYLRDERSAATLQPTALVHDAYLRLIAQDMPDWQSRSHFFGVATQLMRQILVDHARRRNSAKRGGGAANVPLDEAFAIGIGRTPDLVALDDALNELAKIDPRQARIIELRFFGGLSIEECAEALNISTATVGREQRVAEAYLHRQMNRGATP